MRQALRAAAAATVFLAFAQPASAQGFLKRLADRAIDKVEQKTVEVIDEVANGSGNGDTEAMEGSEESVEPAAPQAPASESAVQTAQPKKIKYVSDFSTPPDVEAKKAEYNKFGEASCRACEGGVELDGRPRFPFDQYSGKYNERAARAGSWPVGHTHRWQGLEAVGTITVQSEERVEGFRCRRLEYKLVKGSASAVRPSLICFGLANSSSEVENWHEIY